ncbi:MAG: sigma-70 family RNA polymerase sigma factor [Nannocystaceae bacterium]|nr:sigma-70 family RNA polymerase sigma factor [Nannocystaceae bacterium]
MTDRELLALWRQGDAQAAATLFERHFDGLYRFFRNKAGTAVDDLVQRTLLGAYEGSERFRGESSFRTFLFAIARNQLLVHLAKLRGVERIEPQRDSVADTAPSPSSVVHRRREQGMVLQALRRLPVDHQILLELFYWEQHSGAELASILEVPEGTVRTRLRRARQLLADEVASMQLNAGLALSESALLDDWAKSLRDDNSGQD